MRYRELGRTGLEISEIGFGAEWMEKKSAAEVRAVVERCEEAGINILDCWMAGPEVRSNLGAALAGTRDRWIIQGHIGSTWQDGQYVRTRDMNLVRPAFEDLLARLGTDHVELGMIHYVDDVDEYEGIMAGEFIEYVRALKAADVIGHIGLSTHAPEVAKRAALSGEIEAVMFSGTPPSTSCRPRPASTTRSPSPTTTRSRAWIPPAPSCTRCANARAWALR